MTAVTSTTVQTEPKATTKTARPVSSGWAKRAPLLPALLFTIVVTQIPFILTVVYSFQSWNLVRPGSAHFVGLRNYLDVFADSQFRTAMLNTVLITVICVLVAPSPLRADDALRTVGCDAP